jgi:hypothetical protein
LPWCSGSGPGADHNEMDLGLVGRAAAAATDLRGRCLIAGLLRTAVGVTPPGFRSAISGWSLSLDCRSPPRRFAPAGADAPQILLELGGGLARRALKTQRFSSRINPLAPLSTRARRRVPTRPRSPIVADFFFRECRIGAPPGERSEVGGRRVQPPDRDRTEMKASNLQDGFFEMLRRLQRGRSNQSALGCKCVTVVL